MKLTNYLREAFVRAVVQEIPKPDETVIVKQAQDALYAAMSADVRRVYRKNPKALRSEYVYGLRERQGVDLIVGDAKCDETLKHLVGTYKARNEVAEKLKRVAFGCSTTKQLKDALPEFAHHVPDETKPTANLPAISNIVADMVKLGWKGETNA